MYLKLSRGEGIPNQVAFHKQLFQDHHGPVPDDCVVHHKDNTTTNNTLNNLQVESSKCVRVTRKVPDMCFESVTCFACFFLDAWFKTSGPRQIVTRAVANLGGAWVVHDTRVLFVVRTGGRAERTVRRGHCQPV